MDQMNIHNLMELKKLYEAGILTKEEMEAEKAKILQSEKQRNTTEESISGKKQPSLSMPTESNNKWLWIGGAAIILLVVIFLAVSNNKKEDNLSNYAGNNAVEEVGYYNTVETEQKDAYVENEIPKEEPTTRYIEIEDGYYYNASYSLTVKDGIIHCVSYINGQEDTNDYKCNKNIDENRILDQFEGLAYFWAASEVGSYIINDIGSYSEDMMYATIRLLKKSADAFSVNRGNSPIAYEGAKSRYDMLSELLNRYDEEAMNDIEMIVWGMGEHPVSTKDIKFE